MRRVLKETDKQNLASNEYVQALIETIRDPFLILDSTLYVVEANGAFFETFRVTKSETEKKSLYQLGNGQWNIPGLKKLLENILPSKKTVRDYEVAHNFPKIGDKVMLINANQIDSVALIVVAFEDITASRDMEKRLGEYTKGLESKIAERTEHLAARVKELENLNESMVGREIKMVELRREIVTLKNLVERKG